MKFLRSAFGSYFANDLVNPDALSDPEGFLDPFGVLKEADESPFPGCDIRGSLRW